MATGAFLASMRLHDMRANDEVLHCIRKGYIGPYNCVIYIHLQWRHSIISLFPVDEVSSLPHKKRQHLRLLRLMG